MTDYYDPRPEIWKPIINCSAYAVSTHGRVRREKASRGSYKGKILTPWVALRTGYPMVSLSLNCRVQKRCVHTLVLETFVKPRPTKSSVCNHKDGNKQNNFLGNLEWVTPKFNSQHAVANGFSKKSHHQLKPGERWLARRISKTKISLNTVSQIFQISVDTASRIKNSRGYDGRLL